MEGKGERRWGMWEGGGGSVWWACVLAMAGCEGGGSVWWVCCGSVGVVGVGACWKGAEGGQRFEADSATITCMIERRSALSSSLSHDHMKDACTKPCTIFFTTSAATTASVRVQHILKKLKRYRRLGASLRVAGGSRRPMALLKTLLETHNHIS